MSNDTPRTYAPKELASELDVDPKRLRAYLRMTFPRPIEAKNTSWAITEEAANAARSHFAKSVTVAPDATDPDSNANDSQ